MPTGSSPPPGVRLHERRERHHRQGRGRRAGRLEKKGFEQTDLAKPRPEEAVITLNYRHYRVRFAVRVADAADPEPEEEHRCTCPTCTCNHGEA